MSRPLPLLAMLLAVSHASCNAYLSERPVKQLELIACHPIITNPPIITALSAGWCKAMCRSIRCDIVKPTGILAGIVDGDPWICVTCGVPVVIALVLGVMLFVRQRMQVDSDARRINQLIGKMDAIHWLARVGQASQAEISEFYSLMDECLGLINSRRRGQWAGLTSRYDFSSKREWIDRAALLVQASVPRQVKSQSMGEDVEKIAHLRKNGMISDHEFEAFAERFKVSTGDRAKSIIQAITDLHSRYSEGAMTEGNYHAALWSLLDKLDKNA